MQRDSLEPGPGDHESTGRPPLPPLRLDEISPDPRPPSPAHRKERHSDCDLVSAFHLCRSELSRGQSASPGWDPIVPSLAGTLGTRRAVAAKIGADSEYGTRRIRPMKRCGAPRTIGSASAGIAL